MAYRPRLAAHADRKFGLKILSHQQVNLEMLFSAALSRHASGSDAFENAMKGFPRVLRVLENEPDDPRALATRASLVYRRTRNS